MSIPCPIPYQGSKRKLASKILRWLPTGVWDTFYDPFAGSGAMTLAVAETGRAEHFVLSDVLEPLAGIWRSILDDPERLVSEYESLWNEQLECPRTTYDRIRKEFNATGEPAKLLYLIVRCVKNAVRFNPQGGFNQSPDNRRLGMRPKKMKWEVFKAHRLLAGKTTVEGADYRDVLKTATCRDVVYMDPPYQGVSNGRDKRYFQPLILKDFLDELNRLNQVRIPYLVSFDGQSGSRSYGEELPEDLGLKRILLDAGRSTQATFLGRNDMTVESLYVSPALLEKLSKPASSVTTNEQLSFSLLE